MQKPDLDEGPEASFSEVGSALGLLLVASLCAFALMNIGPVIVQLLASDSQAEAAGRFVNGVVIARIPLFLFQAVQASLLPKLSPLAHSGHLGDFRSRPQAAARGRGRPGRARHARSAPCSGPFIVEIMFPSADLGARTMGLLAAGAGLYMLAMACAQAVIALGGHGDQAIGWASGSPPSSSPCRRRRASTCSCGSSSGCSSAARWRWWSWARCWLRRLAAAGPLTVDSGDLIEAIHERPDRALSRATALGPHGGGEQPAWPDC